MKDWRVHFLWAIVTVFAAVLSARVASQRELVLPPPQSTPTPSLRKAAATVKAEDVPVDSVIGAENPVPAPPPDLQERIAEHIRP